MKKIFFSALLACALATFTSCEKELKWQDSTDADINYWTRSSVFLYFVDKENKSFFDINKPSMWPVISDRILTESEVQQAMNDVKVTNQTVTVSGKSGGTFTGYSFCDGNVFLAPDPSYNMPFVLPSVKVDNTGETHTYLYIMTSTGIDVDTLTTKLRYAKEDGDNYTEIKSIYYNKAKVYAGGGNSVGVIVQK